VIDVLLARSPVPLFVVRDVYPLEDKPFELVTMVVADENETEPVASRWATGLVAPGGQLALKLVLEQETVENVRQLMRSLDPEAEVSADELLDAMQRAHVRLHRALQMSAESGGFQYELDVREAGQMALREPTRGDRHPLLVLALERTDHASQGRVHDRIRQSPYCVLVVVRNTPAE
jgi:hypothetical protein